MAVQYPITPEEKQRVEAFLLGSLFLYPEAGSIVGDILQLEAFSEEHHRLIYEAILTVLGTSERITMDSVSNLFLKHELEQIGGVTYLQTLKQQAENTTIPIEEQARLLKQATMNHSLSQGEETICTLTNDRDDFERVVDELEQVVHVVQQKLSPEGMLPPHTPSFQADLDDYLSELDTQRRQRTVFTGIPTGFADLDTITGGLQRSELIVIAGPPSIGKTSFALSIALHILLKLHHSVGLFSLEAPKRHVIRHLLSMEAHLDQRLLRSLEMEDSEWARLGEVSAKLSEAKLWMDDTASLSTAQLYDKAHLLVDSYGVELLIVDYVHLMLSSVYEKRHENRAQEMGEISRSLKALARDLNIPVLALAQVSRAYEARPLKNLQLSDLRDGSLENDADLVLFLSRAEENLAAASAYQLTTISIAKHRNGPRADLDICFHPASTRFFDLETLEQVLVPEQPFLSPP